MASLVCLTLPGTYFRADGAAVLDKMSKPIRKLDSIPVTLSSATTGWFLEALRRNDARK